MALRLDTPVQYVKGVGPRRARIFESAGIRTVEDLLRYLPFRYEDRTQVRRIRDLVPGEEAVVEVEVAELGSYSTRRRSLEILELLTRDETGLLPVKFFNQTYLAQRFRRGSRVVFFGTPKADGFSGGVALINPEYEILGSADDEGLHTGRIVPVYRRIGTLTTRQLRQVLCNVVTHLETPLPEKLPEYLRRRLQLPDLAEAYRMLHFPETPQDPANREALVGALNRRETPAHRRLVFEEFFWFQVGLQQIRARRTTIAKPHRIVVTDEIRRRLRGLLPFPLTGAQRRVLKEIVADLQRPTPMHRLLQGDVGSGKTAVAAMASAVVVENGYQVALMAPTELLAEQHHRTFQELLGTRGYRLALLTSSVSGTERKKVLRGVREGEIQCLVGTHALIQQGVEFARLAFVVVDEQHRFGVLQRLNLARKGTHPDVLVMTATPIPRSLALTFYGDLEVSILDELPPGRKPVRTFIKREKSREEVYGLIRRFVAAGRQVYVVYPLVEESEKSDLKAATEGAERLAQVFPEFTVGLLHGRMKAAEKDDVMRRFAAGDLQILVSTTVIEVGIDVPNACLMVIEHAERFGLSQLHQLRGRVGRGDQGGVCVLLVDQVRTRKAVERLQIMRQSNDGFVIAEKDLEIRGPGEFAGTRQSGLPEFRFGDLARDRQWMELAKREAAAYVERLWRDPRLHPELERLEMEWRKKYGLIRVG
ncbi:MAG: ATP-dependent DNA helicase RecG [Acidobacteriota bacterium]